MNNYYLVQIFDLIFKIFETVEIRTHHIFRRHVREVISEIKSDSSDYVRTENYH